MWPASAHDPERRIGTQARRRARRRRAARCDRARPRRGRAAPAARAAASAGRTRGSSRASRGSGARAPRRRRACASRRAGSAAGSANISRKTTPARRRVGGQQVLPARAGGAAPTRSSGTRTWRRHARWRERLAEPTSTTPPTRSGNRAATSAAAGPAERVADEHGTLRADGLARREHALAGGEQVERPGGRVGAAEARQVDGDRAVRAREPLDRAEPVAERAAEAVQEHDRGARARLDEQDAPAAHADAAGRDRHGPQRMGVVQEACAICRVSSSRLERREHARRDRRSSRRGRSRPPRR